MEAVIHSATSLLLAGAFCGGVVGSYATYRAMVWFERREAREFALFFGKRHAR